MVRLVINLMGLIVGLALGLVVTQLVEASVADWLSFAGALIGAAVTIAGSVGVLEWQRTREQRARRDLLLHALKEAAELTHGFHSADEPGLRAKTGHSVDEHTRELRRSVDRLRSLVMWMKPDNVAMLQAFDEVKEMDGAYGDLADGLDWVHVPGADLGGLNATGHEIKSLANSAIKKLGGAPVV